VQLFTEHHDRIRAVVLDLTMPGRSGLQVARDLQAIDPQVRIILSSGYSPEAHSVPASIAAFLTKPYDSAQLLATLRRVLDGAPPDAGP
jgi:DNA-binding response OmpR family regulator